MMAVITSYASISTLQRALGITDSKSDEDLAAALEAASRQIDAHCGKGRKFFQDENVVARKYWPSEQTRCSVDDISTTTGLIVQVDSADDGTFATTLTEGTDFLLAPINAAAETPVHPYTCIQLLDGQVTSYTALSSGRPYVQVTAKFGWPAIPDAVARACIVQARAIWKAQDTSYGSFQISIDGTPIRLPALDPMARAQLEPFVRFDEVDW